MKKADPSRMWASASFVGVLIVIGLPLWWKTTEVYRVSLPYDRISMLNNLPHIITTDLIVLANDEPTAAEIAGLIEIAFEESDVIKINIRKQILSDTMRQKLQSVTDENKSTEVVASVFNLRKYNTFYVVQKKQLLQDVWIANERVAFFRDVKASNILVEVLNQWVYQTQVVRGGRAESPDVWRQLRFPPSSGYHILLSVIQPKPEELRVDLDAGEAVEDYIGTFTDELSLLHNFTLKSQWLYMLDFDFQSKKVPDNSDFGRHFAVREDRLHSVLTQLEQRASPHVSSLPTINLALYTVPCTKAPLALYDINDAKISTPVQAFMSPKWGGVVLGNPTEFECREDDPVYQPSVRQIMGTFLTHLRKLLGIADTAYISGAHLEPLRSVIPRRWEVDNLLRLRTIEQISSAERTLQSLAQLLGKISNIVINDDVGASINAAVESVEYASYLITKGALVKAYQTSQAAFLAAETAFMEPSLLALLYFPDDQKYAIYIPLFLPIMFPVLLSLKNLLLWLWRKPKNKEKTE